MTFAEKLRFSTISNWRSRRIRDIVSRRSDEFPENRARQSTLRLVLGGTTWITGLFFFLLLVSYFGAGHVVAGGRAAVSAALLAYLLVANIALSRHYHKLAAAMLLAFYMGVAGLGAWVWGINLPLTTLIMSITITLTAILLGSQYALYTAGVLGAIDLGIPILTTLDVHRPDVSWQRPEQAGFGEAIGYCLLFAGLALVSWIFGRQIERSLRQARAAETALLGQKQLLAVKLRERTRTLRAAQLKEVQQLYRFAELGHMSTALLHDLANHLTDLTLDIDTLGARRHTAAIERAKQTIGYLDEMVDKVRDQLQDRGSLATFNAVHSVHTVVSNLRPKFVQAGVEIEVSQRGTEQSLQYEGDAVRFAQVMTVLITNAMEAAGDPTVLGPDRRVSVQVVGTKATLTVRVSDWGVGIPASERRRLFKPFYTTKQTGMGIGLFITKQIIETHFRGTVVLESGAQPTTFKVILPTNETV